MKTVRLRRRSWFGRLLLWPKVFLAHYSICRRVASPWSSAQGAWALSGTLLMPGPLDKLWAHWAYLHYLAVHKWYVFRECRRYGLYWAGLIHDWSKFLPDEWFPYVTYFHLGQGRAQFEKNAKHVYSNPPTSFDMALVKHKHRNPHHWEYYMVPNGHEWVVLDMPEHYRKEMLADWRAAGRAQGRPDTGAWYLANRNQIVLHLATREWVEKELGST